MKLSLMRPGDTFQLIPAGPIFTIVEHVAGLHPTTRCTSPNVKLGIIEQHTFAAHLHGLPVAFVEPAGKAHGNNNPQNSAE